MTKNFFNLKSCAAFLFAFCCQTILSPAVNAQQGQPPWVHIDPQVLPDQFETNDSLNEVDNELNADDSLQETKVSFANVDVPTYEDSIYTARLGAIVTPVNLVYNQDVKRYIELYVLNRRDQV